MDTSNVSKGIAEFLAETEPFMDQVDNLSLETAIELYDMLDTLSFSATNNIRIINPELRVDVCKRQDIVLERIVDLLPPFERFSDPVNIYTPAVHNYRRWSNTELMKDKGLVGYMLAREVGAHPIMYFGTNPPDYPYLHDLPEMELLFDNEKSGNPETYFNHLFESYSVMDVLVLHGMHDQTTGYLDAYRQLRPDGKVFCGLDMSSYWMSLINWDSLSSKKFAVQCDLLATSCRTVRDALNINPKVSFPCHWFPNGFYNPTNANIIADFEVKENIILTVGRIGTAVKNNSELLAAFAQVSDALEGWKVHLVGPIESEFNQFIDAYFSERPDLKSRVIFTGAITDKDALYKEYARS